MKVHVTQDESKHNCTQVAHQLGPKFKMYGQFLAQWWPKIDSLVPIWTVPSWFLAQWYPKVHKSSLGLVVHHIGTIAHTWDSDRGGQTTQALEQHKPKVDSMVQILAGPFWWRSNVGPEYTCSKQYLHCHATRWELLVRHSYDSPAWVTKLANRLRWHRKYFYHITTSSGCRCKCRYILIVFFLTFLPKLFQSPSSEGETFTCHNTFAI